MGNATTKPNGGSMKVIEDSEDVQKRIEDAGYSFELDAMEAEFSYERLISANASNGSTSAAAAGTKKAGEYTKVGNTILIAFRPLIPVIATGPKIKLKNEKSKNKDTKTSERETGEKE